MRVFYLITLGTIFWVGLMAEPGDGMDRVIAHRGASYDAPENTTEAIKQALEQKSRFIEFDVMEIKDGSLYLFHDKDLKRLAGKRRSFAGLSPEEIKNMDVSRWFKGGLYSGERPPTLRAAVEQCPNGGAIPLIEHKTGSAAEYARVLTELDAVEKVIVQSFDWKFLEEIEELLPEIKLGALGKRAFSEEKKAALIRLDSEWVCWKHSDLTKENVGWLKFYHFKVAAWTVNDPDRARQLIEIGVDKVITSRPAYLGNSIAKKR